MPTFIFKAIFLQLAQVKSVPALADSVEKFAGLQTPLLNSYSLAENPHGGGYVEKRFQAMGAVTLERVDVLSMMGERCYTNTLVVLKDAGGVLWMDEALHDDVFC